MPADVLMNARVRKTTLRGRGVHITFGSTRVDMHAVDVPCRVWRVIKMADGTLRYEERKRCVKATTIDRATREAGAGWRSGSVEQWVEVRPDDWRPPTSGGSDAR